MRLAISHRTSYRYDAPVQYALQELRLTAKSRSYQNVVRWETTVTGGRKEAAFTDQHDNHVDLISFLPGETELTIHSEGEVETVDTSGVYGEHHGFMPLWLFMRPTDLTRPGPQTRRLAKALGDGPPNDIGRMHELSRLVAEAVAWEPGLTHAASTAEEAMETGKGVCQDHAHVFVTSARLAGVPARYVSGYLMMDDRVEQDATHAWAEVHLDPIGWVGFDVSNGISPDDRYVRVATGLDYKEAAPVSGMRFGSGDEKMSVSVRVQQQ